MRRTLDPLPIVSGASPIRYVYMVSGPLGLGHVVQNGELLRVSPGGFLGGHEGYNDLLIKVSLHFPISQYTLHPEVVLQITGLVWHYASQLRDTN